MSYILDDAKEGFLEGLSSDKREKYAALNQFNYFTTHIYQREKRPF
ncbi:MAG: hypothetical protein ACREAK_01050 [Nitrosarchaeum sp.]